VRRAKPSNARSPTIKPMVGGVWTTPSAMLEGAAEQAAVVHPAQGSLLLAIHQLNLMLQGTATLAQGVTPFHQPLPNLSLPWVDMAAERPPNPPA